MTGHLSFGQVETILAKMESVHPTRRGALQSRLKQWQKMGFPHGVNVGRGMKARYGADQLFQLVYVLELLRVGLTPERAIEVVTEAWEAIRASLYETVVCMAGEADHLHYTFLEIDALTSLSDPEADHLHVYCRFGTDKQIGTAAFLTEDRIPADQLADFRAFRGATLDKIARSISLETDSLVVRVWAAMSEVGVDPAILKADFAAWKAALDARVADPELPLLSSDDPEAPPPVEIDGREWARATLGYSTVEEVWNALEANHGQGGPKFGPEEEVA